MWLYLQREVGIERAALRVLHVAPDQAIAPLLQGRPNLCYVSFDIERPSRIRGDLTIAPFKSGVFDLIMCSHVLEHIPDDGLPCASLLGCSRLVVEPLFWFPWTRVEYPPMKMPA